MRAVGDRVSVPFNVAAARAAAASAGWWAFCLRTEREDGWTEVVLHPSAS
jgi:hypothetical protein